MGFHGDGSLSRFTELQLQQTCLGVGLHRLLADELDEGEGHGLNGVELFPRDPITAINAIMRAEIAGACGCPVPAPEKAFLLLE